MGNLKKVELDTTVTVSSNYAGQAAGEIIGASFKEANTISRDLVSVLPDIDFQISLRKIAYSNGRTDYACGFTPTGAVTLSEKLLTPKKIKNEQEICKEDLRQIWSSATMGFSAHNDRMPADVEEALLMEILSDNAEAVDKDIWQGDAGNDGEFDGFITLFGADGSVIKANNGITPLEAAITSLNVEAEIQKVINATPQAVAQASDVVWGMSYNVSLALEQAKIDGGIASGLGDAAYQNVYGGRTWEVINGLPDNTFVVYRRKNLVFGTGLLSDHNEVRIADGDDYGRLDDQVRFKMVYTAGVNYYNSADVVWYLSTTAVV